ncbi:uncharacterized protein SCHCODRAFT_02558515 [Schizophyllum commune H4-8]
MVWSARMLIGHFGYCWGLQEGDVATESRVIRLDMLEKLAVAGWTIIPTPKTESLRPILQLAKCHNAKAVLDTRKHHPAEYEYHVVPVCMLLKKSPPMLYVHGGPRVKILRAPVETFRVPYETSLTSSLPRVHSSSSGSLASI